MDGKKACTECNEIKCLDEFYKNRTIGAKGAKWYYKSNCKVCHRKRTLKHSKLESTKKRRRERQPIHMRNQKRRKTWVDIRRRIANYNRHMRQTSIHHKIKNRLYRRIHHAIKGNVKSARTEKLLGCTSKQAAEWIESQFIEGMTWDNIHIDHIVPCSHFDLSQPDEQYRCFHYSNLQPLFVADNLSKSNKLTSKRKWNGTLWVDVK